MALGLLHKYDEVILLNSGGASAHLVTDTGAKAKHAPGYMPYRVHAFAAQYLTTIAYTGAAVITFWLNTSPGLTATGNYTAIDTITLATAAAGDTGQIFFATPSVTEVRPGQEVVADVTTAGTVSETAPVRLFMFKSQGEQRPGDNSNMTASA